MSLVWQEQQHGELQDEEPEEERLDEHARRRSSEPAAGHEAQDQRGESDDPQLAEQQGEREGERRVDLTQDRGHEDAEARDGQHRADRAVGAPAPRDEAARRERTPESVWITLFTGTGGPRSKSTGISATKLAAAVAVHSATQNHGLRVGAVSRLSPWTRRARPDGRRDRALRLPMASSGSSGSADSNRARGAAHGYG